MKVVSAGPVKTKKIVCPTCAYELEFTGEDVTLTYCLDECYQCVVCPRTACKQGRIVIT